MCRATVCAFCGVMTVSIPDFGVVIVSDGYFSGGQSIGHLCRGVSLSWVHVRVVSMLSRRVFSCSVMDCSSSSTCRTVSSVLLASNDRLTIVFLGLCREPLAVG